MAGVYDDDIATAKELIAEFGQTCYWQKPAPKGSGVPGYPTEGVLPDPVECQIAFFSPRDLDRGVLKFLGIMADTEVPENTQIGLLAGDITFTPENPDTIRKDAVDASRIAIIDIDLLAPNGTPILYTITVAA